MNQVIEGQKTLDRHLVDFVDMLRSAGIKISLGSSIDFGLAVTELGAGSSEDIYWAGRSTLISRPEDTSIYNKVFKSHWLGIDSMADEVNKLPALNLLFDDLSDESEFEDSPKLENDFLSVKYSSLEILSSKDFSNCNKLELQELFSLMNEIRFTGEMKKSRRTVKTKKHRKFDFERSVKSSFRTDGEIVNRCFQESGKRRRRLVLLLDISGSMEVYARVLIRFVHAVMLSRSDVEAFSLGTRLTRLTKELSTRNPDAALSRASDVVDDWSGGTRLGEGIKEFNDRWGIRGMARGATILILSDGWDRGDSEIVGEQMKRLHRVAHRIVWANPLKATPDYEPLAKGMAAALPHIDNFVEGNSFDSLKDLSILLTESNTILKMRESSN